MNKSQTKCLTGQSMPEQTAPTGAKSVQKIYDKLRLHFQSTPPLATSSVEDEEWFGIIETLEQLEHTPIIDQEFHLDTKSIAEAIGTITDKVLGHLEQLGNEVKMGLNINRRTELIQGCIFQITAISNVIAERVNRDDYVWFDDIVFHYKEWKKKAR